MLDRGHRCLGVFPESCSVRTTQMLQRLGVEIRHDVSVETMDEEGVGLSNGRNIPARTILWKAGIEASSAAKWLEVKAGPGGGGSQ